MVTRSRASDRAFALLTAGALLVSGAASAAVLDRVAAVVNEEVVALSEIYDLGGVFIEERCRAAVRADACRREAELEVLDSLIFRVLVRQELANLDLAVTGTEVDRTIDRMVIDYGVADRDALRREFEQNGMAWETVREQLTEQLRDMKFSETVLRPRIAVSEDEVRDIYRRTIRDVPETAMLRLEALIVSLSGDEGRRNAQIRAVVELVERIRAGAVAWEQAASEVEGAVVQSLGDGVRVTDLAPQLQEAVADLQAGEVTRPVPLGDRLLVVRVAERTRRAAVRSYEEAAPELRNRLYEEKLEEEREEWYQQARRRAAVRILLEEP